MKSILFFIESLSGGGAEKVLVTLLRHLDSKKYKITLLTLVDTGILKDDIDLERIDYKTVIKPASTFLVSLWNKIRYKLIYNCLPSRFICKWIIPQKGFDLYVAFTEGFATKVLSFVPCHKIAWVHIDLKDYPWTLEKNVFRNISEEISAYRRFNRIVCVSDSVENTMKTRYGLSNTRTIYNPVDPLEIRKRAGIVDKVNNPQGGIRIVSVGRLSRQKGYDKLIPMIGRLRKNKLDVSLFLIGDGEEYAYLGKLIEENHLIGNVFLYGYQKNPYALMKQMDLFVCSSRAEGFSLAIAEALILGLPVISMNCSGPDLLLDGGKYGVLCANFDDLYYAIEKAVSDGAYLSLLREKAHDRIGFFNIRETIRKIEELFDETICQL